MGVETRAQEFHLPLAQIAQSPLDCSVRYLTYSGKSSKSGKHAQLGLEYDETVPFSGTASGELSLPNAAPSAVQSPWCLTFLSPAASLLQLQRLLDFCAEQQWHIDAIDTLAHRHECTVIRFQFSAELEFSPARFACLQLAEEVGADLVLQEGSSQRVPALAGFDMDSTLIDAEVIDELAKITGIGDQVAAITAAAMRGELDFRDSFKKRMALLKGFSEQRLAEIARQLPLKEGAQNLLHCLRKLGCKTVILSGGFTYFANFLQKERLAVDLIHANELEFAGGVLTGEVIEPIVDGMRKRLLLEETAKDMGLPLGQVVAVGDGANDIPMLNLGALGIAIHPKPKVRREAPQAITLFGLDAALYLFGLNDRQIAELGQP
ncbi:phosphoserine phosphatase SerB [Microbulbifer sp. THAF38]|uniref:phosphoserine phosphatase SerB n=1 Tax=Microbulbifer sp. THAF38 TaxID=2587856 RepID=UPI0012691840|nr:phosphoserine phosphatase SerB [Microbulbifer sp. THAF38]QFT53270.1 Phosphoserine phosphatase [Microbulbifer sp. THAF38]